MAYAPACLEPAEEPACDRSLSPEKLTAATGYRPPSWEVMLRELAGEVRHRKE